jgi:hypothetical protein
MQAFIEIVLFAAVFFACIANARRDSLAILLIPFAIFCLAMTLGGYAKSSYHLLIIGVAAYSIRPISWPPITRVIVKYILVISLFSLSLHEFYFADWTFQNKVMTPQFYYLWGALLIFSQSNIVVKYIAIPLIFLDLIISFGVSARGMIVGCIFALLFLVRGLNSRRKAVISILLLCSFLYTFLAPFFMLYTNLEVISETASNTQRSLMNIDALQASMDAIVTLDESRVFTSASDYQYSNDDSNLTVHNLFLAFALFNGFLPALILFWVVIFSVSNLDRTYYLPFGVFLFFLMLLGPDSFNTRFSLLLILSLNIVNCKNTYSTQVKRKISKISI